jgi:hypothetical protein
MALDTVSGFVTAPGAAFTAWTMAAGDSLTIRMAPLTSRVRLLNFWAQNQVIGNLRLRSPKLHDNVQGIKARVEAASIKPFLPLPIQQLLVPQDTLIAEQTGSAVGGQIESGSFLVLYEDTPGAQAQLISADEAYNRTATIKPVELTFAPGAGGGYTGSQAINAAEDLFKANTFYALLGYLVDAPVCTVAWRGIDTANLRVSGPGDDVGKQYTRHWFYDLSYFFRLALIPVFNSANKFGINVDCVQSQAAGAFRLTSIFAELVPAGATTAGAMAAR